MTARPRRGRPGGQQTKSPPAFGGAEAGRVLGDVLRQPWPVAGVGRCAVRQGRAPDDEVAGVRRDAPRLRREVDPARIDVRAQALEPGVDAFVEPWDRLERA